MAESALSVRILGTSQKVHNIIVYRRPCLKHAGTTPGQYNRLRGLDSRDAVIYLVQPHRQTMQQARPIVHEPTIEFAAPMGGGGYATAINVRILYL